METVIVSIILLPVGFWIFAISHRLLSCVSVVIKTADVCDVRCSYDNVKHGISILTGTSLTRYRIQQ